MKNLIYNKNKILKEPLNEKIFNTSTIIKLVENKISPEIIFKNIP